MNDDLHDFAQFMQQREAAAQAYVRGDAKPLGQLVTHELPATFFGPHGGYRQNADVFATYESDAAVFAQGSETHFEIPHMAARDGVAYWVGFQKATAYLQGQAAAIPMNLRVTEVFRREAGIWKLVHRHADMLAVEEEKK